MRSIILFLLFFPLFAAGQTAVNAAGKDDKVFTVVEKMPEFPGGENYLLAYIEKHTNYPKACKRKNIEGTVYVQFIVNKEGHVIDTKVVRKLHPKLDAEALRVISGLPDWVPGEQSGKKVNVYYTVPIRFSLK